MGKNNNTKCVSTYIRTLYDPGTSYLTMYLYNYNISFGIGLWVEKNNVGYNQNQNYERPLMTSVNYEGASLLFQVAMSIIDETNSGKELKAEILCNNNAYLIFEYKPDQNSQWTAYLTIDKNNQAMAFKFSTHPYKFKNDDGQIMTKVLQTGLGVLAKTIDGYLTGIGADRHLDKLPENQNDFYAEDQQSFFPTGNNNEHLNTNYNNTTTNSHSNQSW